MDTIKPLGTYRLFVIKKSSGEYEIVPVHRLRRTAMSFPSLSDDFEEEFEVNHSVLDEITQLEHAYLANILPTSSTSTRFDPVTEDL